ncbi:hypothetical protein IP92_05414 [Pseudoduganella flava]|uniref:ABC transmembrane type-1 domain-containing protein n=1 Tax=Pseudoduganella flava TaxID=871742 RepID=A0A562PDG1_9BURK|nr:hypothetical protein [Pseudoduganella flava]QGZ42180.1 hypothetical protein GO485_26145 [Pseudoduganella flava]TWI42438.1 hypothetical protein IP92_05414 [Pseudoduganella flava]
MNVLWYALVAGLAAGAAAAACAAEPDICSARFSGQLPLRQVAALRGPIDEAIATLDNSKISLPSPSLASGNLTYLNIWPNFVDRLDSVCVLGYFELLSGARARVMPLVVDHVEVVKAAHPHDETKLVDTARIYFRTPAIEEFADASAAREPWQLWRRNQSLHLKIAAFAYADGQRGTAYFGRIERIEISSKPTCIVAAVLFAATFYVIAGAAVPVPSGQAPGRLRWRVRLARLLPWNITGRSSLAQLQMLLFTLIVATLLFYQWLRTGLLQEISTDLLYLIGISTAGAAGSQLAGAIKKDLDAPIHRYVQALGWFNAPLADAHAPGRPSELLMTNERFDIYKFQMLVFTFVIAVYVIAGGADELGNIQISATLLTLMGMSQGAYIGGRAVDTLAPLQDQLRGMHSLQQRWLAGTDPIVRAELARRFHLAAAQAAAMFGSVFGRVVPDYLLEMPVDAGANPVPGLEG